MLQNDLLKRIERECDRRSEDIIDRYVAKRGNAWLEDNGYKAEFDKDVMVNVDGDWYRCNCSFEYELRTYREVGDSWTPPCEYDEPYYYCSVQGIVNERTKEVLKGKLKARKAA